MLLDFLFNCACFYMSEGGGGAGSDNQNDNENKDENNEKQGEETITLTKADYEKKLQEKFAEGARKASQRGGSNNTSEPQKSKENENLGEKKADNSSEINEIKSELELLRGEKLALKQGVKADYAEDVVAILKGRGLEINKENVKAIVDKHPEWKASNDKGEGSGAKPLGSTSGENTPPAASEKEQTRKLFGLD